MYREIEQVLFGGGYRLYQGTPVPLRVFYKYYQEGFHVVLTVRQDQGYCMEPTEHAVIENQIMDLFYHPQGRLGDFPEGFPVYHVEVLTLLVGGLPEHSRRLCTERQNMWFYQMPENRLIVYENQPGDFWGLRGALENMGAYGNAAGSPNTYKNVKNRIKMPRKSDLKSIKQLPLATIGIAAVNVVVYLVLEIMGNTEDAFFIAAHGGMYPEFVVGAHQWWRILTAMFIHFGAIHLLNNMVIFCCVGSRLERTIGHIRFLMVYFLSGIGGGLLSCFMMIRTGDYAVSAGASGAVFGVIGGLLWAVIVHRGRLEGVTTRGMLLMIALSLYYGFSTIGVDNWCHVGGVLAGFLVCAILYHRKSQKY